MAAAETPADLRQREAQATVRALASALVSRTDLARSHGLSFGGLRDLYTAAGYARQISLTDYRERYERGGVASRIVDAKPAATWADTPELIENPNSKRMTRFEQAWKRLTDRIQVYEYLERVDKLAGIGRYGVLLVGLADGLKLEQEAGKGSGPDHVIYLAPYAEDHAAVEEVDNDPSSPRFGLPTLYKIDVGASHQVAGRNARSSREEIVHWSRILHVADGKTESEIYGTPRMRAVWNRLDDLDKVIAGAGEMFWRGGYQGFQFDLGDRKLKEGQQEEIEEQIEEYENKLRRMFQTRGVDINALENRVADPRGAFQVIAAEIAGGSGIPLRILFGSERGELASTQDRQNWNERITERQTSHANPTILDLVGLFTRVRAVPQPRPTLEIKWPPPTDDPGDRAMIAQRIGSAVRSVSDHATRGERVISVGEFREVFLDLPADLPDMEQADPPGAPEPEPPGPTPPEPEKA